MTKKEMTRRTVSVLEDMFLMVCFDYDFWHERFTGALWYAEGAGLISSKEFIGLLRASSFGKAG